MLPVRSADAELILGAYIGGAHTNQSSLHIQAPETATDLDIAPVFYKTKPFQSPVYYGYRAGYFLGRHIGFETEFTHLKVYADSGRTAVISGTLRGQSIAGTALLNSVVQRFNITHGVNLLLANGVVRKGFRKGAESPYGRFIVAGRIGGGITIPHAENEVLGVSNREHYQVGSPAIQVAGSFEIRLWRRLYGETEVKYTRVRERVDIAQGTAESLLNTVHSVAGLAWHF